LFSPEFKREQVARLVRGEVTISELSRELGISRSVPQRWKHLIAQGGESAVAANEDVVPASELRAAQQKVRELEHPLLLPIPALGSQGMITVCSLQIRRCLPCCSSYRREVLRRRPPHLQRDWNRAALRPRSPP
jgi:hypothetical protein